MPLRVHAIVVTRHGAHSHLRLLRTLDALAAQTRAPATITLVVCGDATGARESSSIGALVTSIVQAGRSASFTSAVRQALPEAAVDAAVWLLDDDTVAAPDSLEKLTDALERSPMAAIVAPKLLTDTEPALIASLGVSMNRLGRAVELTAGELDQGQHDGAEDVMAADMRGMLVRGMGIDHLSPDAALRGTDAGLDLGVRARLTGARVQLTPAAQATVTDEGLAAPAREGFLGAYARRRGQLHRRLAYAPALMVPLHWLALLPLALWRSLLSLLEKRPGAVLPEWAAAIASTLRLGLLARARGRIRRERRSSWASIEPLRVRRADAALTAGARHPDADELRFFGGGGAWAVLAAFVVGAAAFVPLFAWPVLGGGGLLPMRGTVSALWSDALWGLRGVGAGIVGPADPFAGVLAILGTLSPAAPSFALVVLWLAALPLAVLGGWFAATRVTERASLRILAGIGWALAPTFLSALVQARPAAVILHLVLPWFVFAAAVAHRSWGAAGAASLLLLPAIACAPSLAPAAAVLWALALLVALGTGAFAAVTRIGWLPIPLLVIFWPLADWQRERANPLALFADPGLVWLGPGPASDAAGRLGLISGFPSADIAGWASFIGENAGWAALLLVPLAVAALLAPIVPRWRVGIATFLVLLAGLATALLAPGIQLSMTQGTTVPLWPGSGLSLAWVGLIGATLVTIDSALAAGRLRQAAVWLIAITLLVCALPALTALLRGESELRGGPESTLPAYVAADARGEVPRGTLVLTPLGETSLSERVVWGSSDTLGAQSTLVSTATAPVGVDVAGLAVDLISPRVFDAAEELAGLGIRYVLLVDTHLDAAEELRAQAVIALNQRADLVRVGDTDKGTLWRVDAAPVPQGMDAADRQRADRIHLAMLIALAAAALLALPTRESRREARRRPRMVGGEQA